MNKKTQNVKRCRSGHNGGLFVEQIVVSTYEKRDGADKCNSSVYEETFLRRKEVCHRKQTYISLEVYSRLARILPILDEGLSVPAFLDNVLLHHLETHGAELEELFRKKVNELHF